MLTSDGYCSQEGLFWPDKEHAKAVYEVWSRVLFWKQQTWMLFTGVQDHLDLLKVGLKLAPNEVVSQLYQQVSLPVLGFFF